MHSSILDAIRDLSMSYTYYATHHVIAFSKLSLFTEVMKTMLKPMLLFIYCLLADRFSGTLINISGAFPDGPVV